MTKAKMKGQKPRKNPYENEMKDTVLKIRISSRNKSKAQALADIYAGGNLSLWAEHALFNAPRTYLAK